MLMLLAVALEMIPVVVLAKSLRCLGHGLLEGNFHPVQGLGIRRRVHLGAAPRCSRALQEAPSRLLDGHDDRLCNEHLVLVGDRSKQSLVGLHHLAVNEVPVVAVRQSSAAA